jgi:hypothetical protein
LPTIKDFAENYAKKGRQNQWTTEAACWRKKKKLRKNFKMVRVKIDENNFVA